MRQLGFDRCPTLVFYGASGVMAQFASETAKVLLEFLDAQP
jgi:hypothetical protein